MFQVRDIVLVCNKRSAFWGCQGEIIKILPSKNLYRVAFPDGVTCIFSESELVKVNSNHITLNGKKTNNEEICLSREDLYSLIDLALDTKDEAWFFELVWRMRKPVDVTPQEKIRALIDAALMVKDKQWFEELTRRLKFEIQ